MCIGQVQRHARVHTANKYAHEDRLYRPLADPAVEVCPDHTHTHTPIQKHRATAKQEKHTPPHQSKLLIFSPGLNERLLS